VILLKKILVYGLDSGLCRGIVQWTCSPFDTPKGLGRGYFLPSFMPPRDMPHPIGGPAYPATTGYLATTFAIEET
jgi:hypothetical protein